MSKIDNLTSKILEDAKAQQKQILDDAKNQGEAIITAKVKEAMILQEDILQKATNEGLAKEDRIISNATLKIRNEKLEAKQEVIARVFDEAIESLSKKSTEEFISFVKNNILALDILGDEKLILNSEGMKAITSEVVNDINGSLANKGKRNEIKISETVGNFKGGFILERNGIEINYTYEALISSIKDELEYEVAKVLFS